MKKIITIFAALFLVTNVTLAQTQTIDSPSAGITPESRLYFLDQLGETLQTFFTFNPEAKAKLQVTFAAERVAEIKVILEKKRGKLL